MATADRMFYAGLELPAQWWILYRGMEMQHQIYTPVSSTGNVCPPALWCRNMDPLGRWHEYTVGYPHEVSATDALYMLVGSCLQCRGASAIWFGVITRQMRDISEILRNRCLSLLGHVARLDPGVPAHDALRLMVDTKAESQWPAGEDHRAAPATSGSTRMPTLYCWPTCVVEIWDRQGSRSGATVRSY